MFGQYGKDKLVEENPLVYVKLVKEQSHLFGRYDRAEKTENPFAGKHLRFDIMVFKMVKKPRQVSLNKPIHDLTVLAQPRQVWQVDVTHLTVFDQCDEEPKSHRFATVQEQLTDDEVHALDVVYGLVVVGEGDEDAAEFSDAVAFEKLHRFGQTLIMIRLKIRMPRKSPPQIPLNLRLRLLIHRIVHQLLKRLF